MNTRTIRNRTAGAPTSRHDGHGGAAMNRLMAAWATWIRDWEKASRQTPTLRLSPGQQDYAVNAYIDGFLDGINAGANTR